MHLILGLKYIDHILPTLGPFHCNTTCLFCLVCRVCWKLPSFAWYQPRFFALTILLAVEVCTLYL